MKEIFMIASENDHKYITIGIEFKEGSCVSFSAGVDWSEIDHFKRTLQCSPKSTFKS